MSNSTRPTGYDERLVVPLEASRRGAHRARTNALVAALPLLAVVLVVAAVIGVAYALFLRPSGDTSANGPTAAQPAATGSSQASPSTTQPSGSSSPSASPSTSASTSTGTVNKAASVTVYNGTQISGLAASVTNRLTAAGFTRAQYTRNAAIATVSRTTVFYARSSQRATAEAIVQALGVGEVQRRTSGSGIAVVAAGDAQR